MNDITITLTKSQAKNLIGFFEFEFIRSIRGWLEELNNMAYLVDMCEVYKKLKMAEEAIGIVESSDAGVEPAEVSGEPLKMTNFERIQRMSVDELAKAIDAMVSCDCCTRKGCDGCAGVDCIDYIREWLLSEAQ